MSQNNRPIAFASKSFNKAERNKATIEQELFAIHWAIKHYKHYLYGTHFIVQSDHKPLTYLYNLKEASAKLTRLRLELAEFTFTVEHIRGKENVVADALSRIHIDDIRSESKRKEDLTNLNVLVTTRSMARRSNTADNKYESEGIENLLIPNIAHEISKDETKGYPIIHTQLVENTRGPKFYIISIHQKYKSNYELANFISFHSIRSRSSVHETFAIAVTRDS